MHVTPHKVKSLVLYYHLHIMDEKLKPREVKRLAQLESDG